MMLVKNWGTGEIHKRFLLGEYLLEVLRDKGKNKYVRRLVKDMFEVYLKTF